MISAEAFAVALGRVTLQGGNDLRPEDALRGTLLQAASLAATIGVGDGKLAKMVKRAALDVKTARAVAHKNETALVAPGGHLLT